jgi:hypothetical protein
LEERIQLVNRGTPAALLRLPRTPGIPLVCSVLEVSPCQVTSLAMGKIGDRVAVLPHPVFRDNFSGYQPSDGLSSPRLLDPVYPFLLFWGHFLLPRSGGNLPLSAPPLSMETVGSPEVDVYPSSHPGTTIPLASERVNGLNP